jgi:hypothetical protein
MKNLHRSFAILLSATTLALAGCSSMPGSMPASSASSTESTTLTGEWSYAKDSMAFDAEVAGDMINIYLTLDESRGLYWAGTFEEAAVDGQIVASNADTAALEASLYGSQSDTKEFTFRNGQIEFEFTIMGVVTEIGLTR